MKVEILQATPLNIASKAIRTCYDSHHLSTKEKDLELIYKVANINKHSSTIEHLVYSFAIEGISRACLQELARHRLASYSVKSSRYTLKELRKEKEINEVNASKYIKLTGNLEVDTCSIKALQNLHSLICRGISMDIAKFAMPECYLTSLVWTINARSLQNFLKLRTSKNAMWEIRELAFKIYNAIPNSHKFLFKEHTLNEEDSI